MKRLSYLIVAGGFLVSALLLSAPANQSERSLPPLPGWETSRRLVPLAITPARGLFVAIPPEVAGRRRADGSQTMGSGSVDVALDGAPEDGADDPRDASGDDDAFAGIGEDDKGEPIDEWAAMTAEERAQAMRNQLAHDPDDQPDHPEQAPDDPRDAPGDDEPFAGIGEDNDGEPVDDWMGMTPEERAVALRRSLDQTEEQQSPEDPGDAPREQPFSVLSYLEDAPREQPFSVLGYLEDVPPARPLEAYDLSGEEPTDAPAEDEADDPRDTPRLTPGVYVHAPGSAGDLLTPEDPTLDSVVLGQWFDLNVAIPTAQLDKDGDGRPDRESVEVRMATEDGSETTVTLRWDGFGAADGLFVFQSRESVSLGGKSQGLDVAGSITGLDLDSYEGSKTVTIGVDGLVFGAIDVYTNNTQRGLRMIGRALDAVSNVLVAETSAIRQLRSSPEAASDEQIAAELDAWQKRIEDRMAVVQRTRALLANPDQLPKVKLKIGQFYVERLIGRDENGLFTVADQVIPFSGFETQNTYSDLRTMDNHVKILEDGIRDQLKRSVIEDVLPAYLVGAYDQINQWNVPGRFFWTVAGAATDDGPTDHFGRRTSVTHVAFEMGLFVVMIKLPDVIADWAAGGFGTGRLPSIGIPRFRGTPIRGNVLVPKGPGRLAQETGLGTQPLPGTGGRLPLVERQWWQGRVGARTQASRLDETMGLVSRELDELDNLVMQAQRKGVPFSEVEAALANARMQGYGADPVQSLRNAISGVKRELVIRAANREGYTIVVHPSEMQEFRTFAGDIPTGIVRQEDLLMIQGLKARAEFEARRGGEPMYSPDEVELGRRLVKEGENLKTWLEFWENEGGLRHMFDDAAIADLQKVFGGTGPPPGRIAVNRGFQRLENRVQRGETPTDQTPNPFDSQGRTPEQPGVQGGRSGAGEAGARDVRPLLTLEEYNALVAKQAAGERLDLAQIARPGIAKVVDGRVMIQQGSGRWENTRPDEWLDVFIDARAPLPEGAVVIQRGISTELVRQANLLSSRGQTGTNPTIVNAITRDIPEFVRVRVRARRADAPMSDVRNTIDNELARLESEGVDIGNLRQALEPLSPNERLALLRNDAARAQALQTGTAPPPPPPGSAPPPVSGLNQRVIQKALRFSRNENVEWTPEELARLQLLAYPPTGTRPTVIQRRLMPVAEQLGGRLKTLPQDPETYREVLSLADEAYLAFQEMEDGIALARRVGVPEERIRLQTEGLGESTPVIDLERASRGLLREIDQARGIVRENGIPDDFHIVTRMYVAARANQNRLTSGDVAWLRERVDADPDFIRKLSQREFDDILGETHTILDPPGAQDLQWMYDTATGGAPPATPVSQTPTGAIDLATAAGSATLGGPSGRAGANAPVEVAILSTEGSTGPVMEAFFVNRGKPVRIQGEGVVLEPVENVDAATLQRIEQIREAALQGKPVPPAGSESRGAGPMEDPWSGASVVRVVLDAYCLEADLAVPMKGMLYRIAEPARQAAFGNLSSIMEASERLNEQGALDPSNDPQAYFHSIRQWALWVDEKSMEEDEFEDAFAEHAHKNIIAAGQQWNAEVEKVVREYAPGRWRDVEAVLKAAGVR